LKSKTYLKIFFIIIAIIGSIAIIYTNYFARHYPLPLTSRISFDAKIKFIRDKIDPDKIDTLIVGSSLGLNNIQGTVLEESSSVMKNVLNLSVYGARATQVEQILELSDAFPNLKRIIYSAQYSDFAHARYYDKTNYEAKLIRKYIRNELNPIKSWKIMFNACKDIFFCMKRQMDWEVKHTYNNKFEYLGFDSTGSVPLHIYGDDIIGHRWRGPQPNIQNPKSFSAVDRMSSRAAQKGIKYYLIQQPYRGPLAKENEFVQAALNWFAKKNIQVLKKNGGYFVSLHEKLNLGDKYFADRTHLNDQGSELVAREIAKIIDLNEGK